MFENSVLVLNTLFIPVLIGHSNCYGFCHFETHRNALNHAGPPPQYTPEDRSFENLPMHDDDLDLDDPSNLPPSERPPDLPPPMAMIPSNRPISNNYENYPGELVVF